MSVLICLYLTFAKKGKIAGLEIDRDDRVIITGKKIGLNKWKGYIERCLKAREKIKGIVSYNVKLRK